MSKYKYTEDNPLKVFTAYYESEYDKGDRYTPPLLSERRSYKVKRVIIYDDESRKTIVDTTDVDIEDKL